MLIQRQSIRIRHTLGTGLLCLLLTCGVYANTVFTDGFEATPVGPLTEAEAARFLNQATFGATRSTVDDLLASDYELWLDAQLGLPSTLARPFLESITPDENQEGRSLTPPYRMHRWFDTAASAPDQLRQKVAYALSQMIVVSDQDATLFDQVIMMAEWNDLLVRNALGNYRTLLGEVARSPMMGVYLSHLRNRRFEIDPRCRNLLAPEDDNGGEYYDCNSPNATANGSQEPVIVRYDLPRSGLVAPDENFAREVMQLFSVGLVERELDFTPIEIGGEPVATYDQAMITDLARVLTGLGFACSGTRTVAGEVINRTCGCTGIDCNFSIAGFASIPPEVRNGDTFGLVHPDRYEPLICYPRFHDTGRDSAGFQLPGQTLANPSGATIDLLPGETIPDGMPATDKSLVLGGAELFSVAEISPGEDNTTALNCAAFNLSPTERQACVGYCDGSLEAALDVLFQHPNTAAMVARQLIQRLVTSNPSAAYIQRVAEAFVDNGNGTRGDLAAVVRAVLLDEEARSAPIAGDTDDGKPREPMLKLVQLWRSIGAESTTVRNDDLRQWPIFTEACPGLRWPTCAYLQRPHGAPSVFNFYEPDFQQPGPVADAGLFSPELQIVNESSAILAANDLYAQICYGWGNNDCHGSYAIPRRGGAVFSPTALGALPGGDCGSVCDESDDIALINELDLLLLGQTMSGELAAPADPSSLLNTGMRGTLFRLLREDFSGALGSSDAQTGRHRAILYLLHLIALSPEFAARR